MFYINLINLTFASFFVIFFPFVISRSAVSLSMKLYEILRASNKIFTLIPYKSPTISTSIFSAIATNSDASNHLALLCPPPVACFPADVVLWS